MDAATIAIMLALLGLFGFYGGEDAPDEDEMEETPEEENQVLIGTPMQDTLTGGGGNDLILALEDDDTVVGGDGDDLINPGSGEDTVEGGDGDDVIVAGLDLTTIVLEGEDEPFITEDADPDEVLDVLGIDLDNPPDLETLLRNAGKIDVEDGFSSETDADVVDGGAGDDDFLIGAFDTATGGEGSDDFLVASVTEEYIPGEVIKLAADEGKEEVNPIPLITDFDPAEDTLILEGELDSRESFAETDEMEASVAAYLFYDVDANETSIRIIEERAIREVDNLAFENDVSAVRFSGLLLYEELESIDIQFLNGATGELSPVRLLIPY